MWTNSLAVVLVYGVLFMDWGEMAGRDVKPFAGVCIAIFLPFEIFLTCLQIREWVHETASSIWTTNPAPRQKPSIVLPNDEQLQNVTK